MSLWLTDQGTYRCERVIQYVMNRGKVSFDSEYAMCTLEEGHDGDHVYDEPATWQERRNRAWATAYVHRLDP